MNSVCLLMDFPFGIFRSHWRHYAIGNYQKMMNWQRLEYRFKNNIGNIHMLFLPSAKIWLSMNHFFITSEEFPEGPELFALDFWDMYIVLLVFNQDSINIQLMRHFVDLSFHGGCQQWEITRGALHFWLETTLVRCQAVLCSLMDDRVKIA